MIVPAIAPDVVTQHLCPLVEVVSQRKRVIVMFIYSGLELRYDDAGSDLLGPASAQDSIII